MADNMGVYSHPLKFAEELPGFFRKQNAKAPYSAARHGKWNTTSKAFWLKLRKKNKNIN